VFLGDVVVLVNGAVRVRLAGFAIGRLHDGVSDDHARHDDLRRPAELLEQRAERVSTWYAELGRSFADGHGDLPAAEAAGDGTSFLAVILPEVGRCGDPDGATHAEQLLWAGQYVGDVDQLRGYLLAPAAEVRAARARPWWQGWWRV